MRDLGYLLGLVLLILLCVLATPFVRRAVLARGGGTITLSVRLSARLTGRGWAPGFARFGGDELRWYRMFGIGLRPKRVLSRRNLVVTGRRVPEGPELLVMPPGSVILSCTAPVAPIEIAMAGTALTGFLSWLEAAPPGAASRRSAA